MSPRRAWLLLGLALAGAAGPLPGSAEESRPIPHVEVIYFHRTLRCPACLDMEKFTDEAVGRFPAERETGRLRWRIINLDGEGNKHFEQDYALEFNSVVLARQANGREIAWTNLPSVWPLVGDRSNFISYVEMEIARQLEQLPKD